MILADEHISTKMIAAIKAIPLEVESVKEKFKDADDDRIMKIKISVNGFSLTIFQVVAKKNYSCTLIESVSGKFDSSPFMSNETLNFCKRILSLVELRTK
jgi:hypothetical protein